MAVPITLPVVAGLSIIGAASGVWLGKSAVADINPVYFEEAESRFHADLVPYRSPDWASVQAAEFVQAGQTDTGTFCLGCIDYPEEYVPAADRAPEGIADFREASASDEGYEQVEAQPVMVERVSHPEWERVELYASSPATAERQQAEQPQPAGEMRPAEGGETGTF